MECKPIGVIHTPFERLEEVPRQASAAADVEAEVEVFPEYRRGLEDLDGFSHVGLVYLFHRSQGFALEVVPPMDDRPHGLFATRSPRRPNPIGISTVELVSVTGGRLQVRGVDMLDGTPLLDIKPYVPGLDDPGKARTGWLDQARGGAGGREEDGSGPEGA